MSTNKQLTHQLKDAQTEFDNAMRAWMRYQACIGQVQIHKMYLGHVQGLDHKYICRYRELTEDLEQKEKTLIQIKEIMQAGL